MRGLSNRRSGSDRMMCAGQGIHGRQLCGAAILAAGALLSLCALSASAQTAAAPAAVPAAAAAAPTTARSAGPLVSTGLDEKTGGVRLLVNKSVTLNTNRPYKRLNVGQPDI